MYDVHVHLYLSPGYRISENSIESSIDVWEDYGIGEDPGVTVTIQWEAEQFADYNPDGVPVVLEIYSESDNPNEYSTVVTELVNWKQTVGPQTVDWDGKNEWGELNEAYYKYRYNLKIGKCFEQISEFFYYDGYPNHYQFEYDISEDCIPNTTEEFHKSIAERYSPAFWQECSDMSVDAQQDFITNFDWDFDWTADNNVDHSHDDFLERNAYVYYSVVETFTHWFITYGIFHTVDFSGTPWWIGLDHENDMEGTTIVVTQ